METAFLEVFAWLPPEPLEDAKRSIMDALPRAGDADERAIRLGAVGLIDDALHRWRGYRPG